MPWCIDYVKGVLLAITRGIGQGNALRFDGNATLALQIHGIEYLRFHFAFAQAPAKLNEAIGKRGFPVVNMSDNRKVSD
jgi:hypothetical protein